MPERSIIIQKERKTLRKEIEKMPETLPSVNEMLRNAEEASGSAAKYRKTYAVDDYHVPTAEQLFSRYGYERPKDAGAKRTLEDLALREKIRTQEITGISKEQTDREISFRTKDECYKKKNRDQEKAAIERNEQFSDVTTDELMEQAEEIRSELDRELTEKEKNDTYALAQREYNKQYIKVIEDLINTRQSEGKWYGNYKSHIALAEEKYRFYTEESKRIIGRNQAEIFMKKKEYKEQLDAKMKADPVPELDLTKVVSDEFIMQEGYNLDKAKINVVKKAMKEYRECAEKKYEILKQIETLQEMYNAEELAKGKALEDDPNYKLNGEGVDDAFLDLEVSSSKISLYHYLRSLRLEYDALKFHEDAALLCVKHIMDEAGDEYEEHSGVPVSCAAYIKDHYGVEIRQADTKAVLRDQKALARRVGIEGVRSDVDFYYNRRLNMDSRLVRYFSNKWVLRSESAVTGYECQNNVERMAAEQNSFQLFAELVNEELAHRQPRVRELPDKELDEIMEKCVNISAITQPLPDIQLVHAEREKVDFQKLVFAGHRNERGEFESGEVHALSPQELLDRKRAIEEYTGNISVIRDMSASSFSVKRAISAMLPVVNEAFSDIDAFMNVGDTKEIFTEKSHEDVFRYTAGLPSFERKARQLRDLISTLLQRDKILQEMVEEPGNGELQKDLYRKWMFMNRVLGFVDYRRQVMERGYDSTLEDWIEDDTIVEDFWTGDDHTATKWNPAEKRFVPLFRERSVAAASASAADATEDAVSELSRAVASAVSSVSAATAAAASAVSEASASVTGNAQDLRSTELETERNWVESMDDLHQANMERRRKIEDALSGMTRNEKRFLRMEYYEASVFSTRKEQEDAIRKDLRKGTDIGSYMVSRNALCIERAQLSDKLRQSPDSAVLAERISEIDRQVDSIDHLIADTEADIDKRAAELVKLVKKPETFGQEADEGIEEILGIINDPNIDASITDGMKTEVRKCIEDISGSSKTQKRRTVIELMRRMTKALERPYLEAANAYTDALLDDMRTNRIPNIAEPKLRETIENIISDFEKRRNSTSVDSMQQTIGGMRSAYYKISKSSINSAPPVPGIMKLYASAQGMLNKAENAGNKRTINFRDWVGVRRYLIDEEGATLEEHPEEEIFSEVEERAADIHKEQNEMASEADKEAVQQAMRSMDRIKAAGSHIILEQRRYFNDVKVLNEAMLQGLIDVSGMEKKETDFLLGLGCLVLPLGDCAQLKGDGLKDVPQERIPEMEQGANTILLNMMTLRNSTAGPESIQDAARSTIGYINAAYEDIGTFVSSAPGKNIVAERKPADYMRMPGEPENPDNYSDDLEQMTMLAEKTGILAETVNRVLEKRDVLSDEDIEGLEHKAEVLNELGEFLEWRKNIISVVRNKLNAPSKFIKEVREEPENWTREAFVWEQERQQ